MRLLLLFLICVSQVALADRVYIRDTLYVPLRGGQSSEHRILHRGLRSGTELERLEVNEETGYTRVRTDEGLEGWLQSQYLVDDPIASTQLNDTLAQMEELEAKHQQTLLRLRETREQQSKSSSESDALREENQRLSEELERITTLAADVINIEEQNRQLTQDRDDLMNTIDDLNVENDTLSDTSAQQWFLRGAGTILIGLLFGFWIGRRIYHRRSTGGWA